MGILELCQTPVFDLVITTDTVACKSETLQNFIEAIIVRPF